MLESTYLLSQIQEEMNKEAINLKWLKSIPNFLKKAPGLAKLHPVRSLGLAGGAAGVAGAAGAAGVAGSAVGGLSSGIGALAGLSAAPIVGAGMVGSGIGAGAYYGLKGISNIFKRRFNTKLLNNFNNNFIKTTFKDGKRVFNVYNPIEKGFVQGGEGIRSFSNLSEAQKVVKDIASKNYFKDTSKIFGTSPKFKFDKSLKPNFNGNIKQEAENFLNKKFVRQTADGRFQVYDQNGRMVGNSFESVAAANNAAKNVNKGVYENILNPEFKFKDLAYTDKKIPLTYKPKNINPINDQIEQIANNNIIRKQDGTFAAYDPKTQKPIGVFKSEKYARDAVKKNMGIDPYFNYEKFDASRYAQAPVKINSPAFDALDTHFISKTRQKIGNKTRTIFSVKGPDGKVRNMATKKEAQNYVRTSYSELYNDPYSAQKFLNNTPNAIASKNIAKTTAPPKQVQQQGKTKQVQQQGKTKQVQQQGKTNENIDPESKGWWTNVSEGWDTFMTKGWGEMTPQQRKALLMAAGGGLLAKPYMDAIIGRVIPLGNQQGPGPRVYM